MDKNAEKLLKYITDDFYSVLGDNLVGIYLHGSLVFGCFNPAVSDIDFIAVVEKEPDEMEKYLLIHILLKHEKHAPAKGLEMSVVLAIHCRKFVYPTPYCLHYSAAHGEKYLNDTIGHIRLLQGTDRDLAAHFTVINHTGITLWGKDKTEVFSPVPDSDYMDSIIFDIENCVEEIADNPVYLTLNLCRVLAYKKEKAVLSKADGGLWGIKNLPQYEKLIKTAYKQYTENITADFSECNLMEFAEYMIKEINT